MDSKLTVVKGSTTQPAKSDKAGSLESSTADNNQEAAADATTKTANGSDDMKKTTYISKESMAHMRIR